MQNAFTLKIFLILNSTRIVLVSKCHLLISSSAFIQIYSNYSTLIVAANSIDLDQTNLNVLTILSTKVNQQITKSYVVNERKMGHQSILLVLKRTIVCGDIHEILKYTNLLLLGDH